MYLLRSHLRQIICRTKTYSEVSFMCRKFTTEKHEKHEEQPKQENEKQRMHDEGPTKAIAFRDTFESINNKNRQTYLDVIHIFENQSIHRRGHVEFIYAALKNMESFGVHQDVEVYKALVDVLPKGKFIPTNIFQAEFMHYPKQQQCVIDLLEQMEDWGVIPDYEMEDILLNVFGRKGHPVRKFWRMMYWMPKFKNLSPWLVPNPPPSDIQELARLAVERMCSVDIKSVIKIYETKDLENAVDDTWIVSGQSSEQIELLQKHPTGTPVYIEGPFLIWLRNKCVHYFMLRSNPVKGDSSGAIDDDGYDPDDVSNLKVFRMGQPIDKKLMLKKSVHEQRDGTIFAICATGTSTKDSLLSWVRCLEEDGNPFLGQVPVLFKFRSLTTTKDVAPIKNEKLFVK